MTDHFTHKSGRVLSSILMAVERTNITSYEERFILLQFIRSAFREDGVCMRIYIYICMYVYMCVC
jgi:hypothetical protein